jgi:hypothetical protein
MTTNEWITLASSIGAMGAAVVALLTLLELFRQRKASYKPDLCIIQNYFDVGGPGPAGINIPLDWSTKGDDGNKSSEASVKLVNIGFGAAKNVEASWIYDSEKLVSEINTLAQKSHQGFYLENEHSFLSIKSNKSSIYSANAEMNTFNFEYLLPAGHDKGGRDLHLPPSYTLLVSAYIGLCIKSDTEFRDIKLPALSLRLSYKDIGKGVHTSTHRLSCEILSLMKPAEESDKSPEFSVKIVESS